MFTEIALVSGGIDSVLVTAHVPHAQPLFVITGNAKHSMSAKPLTTFGHRHL